jgi:hypothetical protein
MRAAHAHFQAPLNAEIAAGRWSSAGARSRGTLDAKLWGWTLDSDLHVGDRLRTPDGSVGAVTALHDRCDVTIDGDRRARFEAIAERLGYSEDHVEDRLPVDPW